MRLIDAHAHLEQVPDVEPALERAKDSDVVAVLAVSMDLASNRRILNLAERHQGFVYPALGIHPWAVEVLEIDAAMEYVQAHIGNSVAIGEIGLDYWIKKDRALQREVFGKLLKIAAQHQKPVITHSGGSYEDVFRLVRESGNPKAVFHWYSGPIEMTDEIIKCGYYISATPAVGYSERHREVIKRVPIDNLLLETDCPVKYKDIESEPASVRTTLEEVARLKGEAPDLIAEATTENCTKLFGLEKRIT
jgi:TatD DNase family protein